MSLLRAVIAASIVAFSSALTAQSTTTTLSVTPTTASYGTPVNASAVVTSGSGSSIQYPAGNVTFTDGSTNIGSAVITSDIFTRPSTVPLTQLTGPVDTSVSNSIPGTFITGDLNGDGKQDLIFYSATAFQVFLNTGAGTYAAQTVNTNGLFSPVLVDYDGDGKVDIVSLQGAITNFTNALRVLAGDGTGSFQAPVAASAIALPVGAIVTGTVAADFSGSGRGDLAVFYVLNSKSDCTTNFVGTDCASRVAIYTNSGSGVFVGHTPAVLSIATPSNYSVISSGQTADFNKDGKADLLVASPIYPFPASGQRLYYRFDVLLGDGSGTLTLSATDLYSGRAFDCQNPPLAIGDFGSGKVDIVGSYVDSSLLPSAGPSQLVRFAGNGDGTFSSGTPIATLNMNGGCNGTAAVDLDGDGKLDVVEGQGYLLRGNGNGTFTTTNVPLPATQYPINISGVGPVVLTPSTGKSAIIFNGRGPTSDAIPVLVSSPVRTAVLPPITNLAAGTHNITATYTGSGSFIASTSAAVAVTLNKQTPTITGTSSPNPALVTQAVTFSVKIVAPNFTPTGTVTFTAGTATLGTATLDSGGNASLPYTFGTAGAQSVTASYAGDANTASASVVITAMTVNAFIATPSSGNSTLTTSGGGSATSAIVVASQNSFSGTVALTCTGLPTGVTCAFQPAMVSVTPSASGNSTLTVSTGQGLSQSNGLPSHSSGIFLAGVGLLFMAAGTRRRSQVVGGTLFALAASITILGAAGCGSGGVVVAPRSYSFNVVTTSGTMQSSTPYTLTVK